jgi:phage terminase large subunit-like protein
MAGARAASGAVSARERAANKRAATRKSRARPANATPPAPTTWRISSSGARLGLFSWKYCRQTKGSTAGRPLNLEWWQAEVFSELLQVEHEVWLELTDADALQTIVDPATFWARIERWRNEEGADAAGLRIHREGLLGISKKNGKSTGSSALALYMLIADGEAGAEVYSTASTKDQAAIVFRQAKEMAEKSPKIHDLVRVQRSQILLRSDGSFYKVVAADAGAQEGINPHCVVNDEIHAHKSRELYDTLRSATIYRDQPMLFSITTAGVDVNGTIGGELYQRGAGKRVRVVDGQVVARKDKQRSFYFRWYQADPKKVRNEDGSVNLVEAKKGNPASWITVEKLREEAEVNRPRGIFLRYHANIWTTVEESWLRPGQWEALRGARGDMACIPSRRAGEHEIVDGEPVVITIDIGLLHDTTAIVTARPPRLRKLDDPEDPTAIRAHIIAAVPPAAGLDEYPPCHEPILTDEPLRLDYIEAQVLEIAKRHRVLAILADPYKFETQLQNFEDMGFLAVRFDQTNARMVPASEALYAAVNNQLLAHDGDPVLEQHMHNSVARDVGGGRWRLDKRRPKTSSEANPTDKMDGAVATAMAVWACQQEEILNFARPTLSIL